MAYSTKIATCCYCGTRAALVLSKVRHELGCASCGAPLHNLKRMPTEAPAETARERDVKPSRPLRVRKQACVRKKEKFYPRKRRKSLFSKALEEIFDVVEDIFD
jgi:predicted  nucleic acid-binding Zn-ribbon protein